MKIANKIFVVFACIIFIGLTVIFNFFPRSTFSELERRELADFPDFDLGKLIDGSLASEISAWYSDTEPYRDEFMTANMQIKGALALSLPLGDESEALTFHASDNEGSDEIIIEDHVNDDITTQPDSIGEYVNNINAAEENAKMAHSGILIVGSAPNARALMAFGASPRAGGSFAELVNKYYDTFDGKVNVYAMVIPNSIEFYCPDKAKNVTKSQSAVINHIYQNLHGAKGVDCYTPLAEHVEEDIFFRTDHHWAPLGAYYAAEAFAKTAGVPFEDLSTYDRHVIHNYVGTMYGYSKDISIKQSPEDFVYWTPTGVDYTTTYIVYNLDKGMHIVSEGKPHTGKFFNKFSDGSGAAYCTFMGGDQRITQVRTSTKNGRRLLILKDSFGNALPGYLFHSFEEIHVVDYRYFTRNIKDYVAENGISDILFAHSIFMCLGSRPITNYNRFLTQNGKIERPAPTPNKHSADSAKAKTKPSQDAAPAVAAPKPAVTEPVEEPAVAPAEPAKEPEPVKEPEPELIDN